MNRRGLDCDMDSEMYQYFFATEFVDMFPQTNGDILLHFILVRIGSRKLTSIRTYRATLSAFVNWKELRNIHLFRISEELKRELRNGCCRSSRFFLLYLSFLFFGILCTAAADILCSCSCSGDVCVADLFYAESYRNCDML